MKIFRGDFYIFLKVMLTPHSAVSMTVPTLFICKKSTAPIPYNIQLVPAIFGPKADRGLHRRSMEKEAKANRRRCFMGENCRAHASIQTV